MNKVLKTVIIIIIFIFCGMLLFGFYTYKTLTYKTLESHIDYSNCVSYIPYLNTQLKNTI